MDMHMETNQALCGCFDMEDGGGGRPTEVHCENDATHEDEGSGERVCRPCARKYGLDVIEITEPSTRTATHVETIIHYSDGTRSTGVAPTALVMSPALEVRLLKMQIAELKFEVQAGRRADSEAKTDRARLTGIIARLRLRWEERSKRQTERENASAQQIICSRCHAPTPGAKPAAIQLPPPRPVEVTLVGLLEID